MQDIEKHHSILDIVKFGETLINFYLDNIKINENMTENPIVNNAINYIYNNLSKDLTLDMVANAIHISKNYLSFLFPKYTGYSFSHWLRISRINRSKDLLINTNLSLLEIALECGFNSQSYFCNVFRRTEKITPKKYRCLQHIAKSKKPL